MTWAATAATATAASAPTIAQLGPDDDEIILPESISRTDVDLRGRYVRQWKDADGTLTLLFNGGFELDFGARRMESNDAVVWISPRRDESGRRYYELSVYLSERAEVREPAGTVTEDRVLLVSNLRTYGRIAKHSDAHSPESLEQTEFYQRARADRAAIEAAAESGGAAPLVDVARPEEVARAVRRPPRVIRYDLKNIEPALTSQGEQVFVATGRVYFMQSGGPESPVLEIQADNAVVFPAEDAARVLLRGEPAGAGADGAAAPPTSMPDGAPEVAREEPAPRGVLSAPGLSERIRAVYLEGDVTMSLGARFVRANRLYYDFERERALILDAVFRADIPQRNIPLYVRADEIRQLSAREFLARRARVTTSEFYTPHYHVGADTVYVRDLTDRDAAGSPVDALRGSYEMVHSTLNVGGVPIGYWPYSQGSLESSETLIRRLRTGYSDDFGVEFETAWHLFNLLGVKPIEGFDPTLRLDYFTKRGPAVGVDADYLRDDYYGLFRGYYINDHGEDSLGPLRDNTPSDENRGRILWRHRHYLPNDWELTLEYSFVSDPGFLEEYRKSEAFEGKDQETLVYLKRARDTEAFTLLANWRTLDFTTQTEHLPDAAYRRIGDTLGPFVNYAEGRVGVVRYRPDDRRFFDDRRLDNTGLTDGTFRTDGREEIELPIKLGAFNLVPFAALRGSFWDGQPRDGGGLWRGLGTYGLRGGTILSRTFDDVESELFDVHRLRHIIKPEYALWFSHSNTRSELITPFDYGIETIDDFYGMLVALKQTWQTQRGIDEKRHTVDLVTLNLEMGLFGDQPARTPATPGGGESPGYANPLRPENSRARNYVAGDLAWRLSDTTSLLYDFNVDLNDGELDRHNVSIAVERLPRLAYIFGFRHAGDIDMSLLGGGFNYKLTEKHIIATRAYWDLDRGRLGEFAVAYVRKLPRWYFSVNFEIDEVFEDIKLSVSLWPEGIPEWALGSRRFTGLGTSTGIRP